MNKRDFLLAGSGAVLSAPGWAAVAAEAAAAAPSTGDLRAWQQRLGETFAQPGAAPLVLQRVDAYAGNGRSEQFRLVFAATNAIPGRAGTRLLRGADGRQLALYLDDGGPAADGQALWRADINHLA